EAQRRLRAVEDLVPGRSRVERHVVARAQPVLLVAQPEDALSLQDEDRLLVGQMVVEREGLLPRLQLEPAHAQALAARGGPEALSPEREVSLLQRLIVALQEGRLVHAFFPSCTSGFCPRGTAVMLARATRSATFCAMRTSA